MDDLHLIASTTFSPEGRNGGTRYPPSPLEGEGPGERGHEYII